MVKIRHLSLCLFLAGTISLSADPDATAVKKLSQLPYAPLVVTMDQASASPSVVLTDKGALIGKSQTPVPFNSVLGKLAALPKEAWPFGRIVLYSSSKAGSPPPPKAGVDKVESDLQAANIRLIPSH